MSRDSLRIERIIVDRMYGMRHEGVGVERLSPQVNVVFGQNARGKTTLGRAIQGVIWPKFVEGWRPTLVSDFDFGGARWHANLQEGRIEYQRNGLTDEPSTLPDESHRDRYWLSLHDLLEAEGKDFGGAIQRAAQGGQDVLQAAESLNFKVARGRERGLKEAVEKAARHVKDIRERQSDLHRKENKLAELQRQSAEAKSAAQRAEFLRLAIGVREAQAKCDNAAEVLEQFPRQLADMRDDDVEAVDRLDKAIRDAHNTRDEGLAQLDDVRADETENLIVRAGEPTVSLKKLEERQRELQRLEGEIGRTEQQLAEARASAAAAWRRIAAIRSKELELVGEAPTPGRLPSDILNSVTEHVRRRIRLSESEAKLEALRTLFGDVRSDDLESRIERTREAARTLREWMGRSAGERAVPAWHPLLALVITLSIGGVGLYLAVTVHWLGWLVVGAAVAIGVLVAMLLVRKGTSPAEVRTRYDDLGLAPPTEWSVSAARRRVHELDGEVARLCVEFERSQRRSALQPDEARLSELRAEVEAEGNAIAEAVGLRTPQDGPQLIELAHSLNSWRDAEQKVEELFAGKGELERQHSTLLGKLNEDLEKYGFDPAVDAREALGAISDIESAAGELTDLRSRIDSTKKDVEGAEVRAREAVGELKRLCDRIGIPTESAADEARRLHERLDDYHDAHEADRDARSVLADRSRRLEADPLFEAGVLERSVEDIRTECGQLDLRAAGREALANEIGGIKRMVDEARRQHDLERALAEKDQALAELQHRYERDCATTVGRLLAEHVESQTRETQLPKVFHRARDLFASFTQDRYELKFDRREATFSGYDQVRGRGYPLEQLSSGTRVQLLLAVRIAFVEILEQGCQLPILLDETLANSDDHRAEAIIDAVLTLCRSGRQVFYFTAQDDEVLKWKRVAERHRDVECAFIPLPGDADASFLDERALPSGRIVGAVPPLGSHTRDGYGALLRVPRWTGWDEVDQIHLWYLEPRLERLYRTLQAGVERWGQLRSLASRGAETAAGYDSETIRPITVRARALQVWKERWLIGRGMRVDRAALERCDAVSSSFIDRIHDRAIEVGGDGRALIESLYDDPVPRFVSQREPLREFLEAEGFIDAATPLSREDIWMEVVGSMNDDLDEAGLTVKDIDDFLTLVGRGPAGGE